MIDFAIARTAALRVAAVSALLCASANKIYSMQPALTPHSHLDAVSATFTPNKITAQDVATMTDAVFSLPHFALIQDFPPEVNNIIKRKFASAEEGYWKGQHPGVREQDIVAAVNGVVAELNLPGYAKTTKDQVRHLRVGMLLKTNPRFMGLRVAKVPIPGEKATILDDMSPLQAYHLVLSLIDQKFVDPFYQVTPEEWERRSHTRQPSNTLPVAKSRPRITTSWDNPRIFEMQERLREALISLSNAEALATLLRTLTALGMD
jgi:hypothetical protein